MSIPNGIVLSCAVALVFPATLLARAAADLIAVRREVRLRRARREGTPSCRST
ncbi:MAG: hypothetical protein HYV09_03325 [Deltaproteobacteria bacterium]|nr:hypothetical protein [Deltaproteobacteria bacterium]